MCHSLLNYHRLNNICKHLGWGTVTKFLPNFSVIGIHHVTQACIFIPCSICSAKPEDLPGIVYLNLQKTQWPGWVFSEGTYLTFSCSPVLYSWCVSLIIYKYSTFSSCWHCQVKIRAGILEGDIRERGKGAREEHPKETQQGAPTCFRRKICNVASERIWLCVFVLVTLRESEVISRGNFST